MRHYINQFTDGGESCVFSDYTVYIFSQGVRLFVLGINQKLDFQGTVSWEFTGELFLPSKICQSMQLRLYSFLQTEGKSSLNQQLSKHFWKQMLNCQIIDGTRKGSIAKNRMQSFCSALRRILLCCNPMINLMELVLPGSWCQDAQVGPT